VSLNETDELGDAAELALGISLGREPQAIFADDTATGVVITRSSSWWNRTRCFTCGHTFRRGDQALVNAVTRTVQHLVPGLECGVNPDAGPDAALEVAQDGGQDRHAFAASLLTTWKPRIPVVRLAADDWRLPRPARRATPTCLYCSHTFRPGEYVAICPCRTAADMDPACGAAVHRDPAAGLPCWDRWQPTGVLAVCPTTAAATGFGRQ
jgi:hypothetical protein